MAAQPWAAWASAVVRLPVETASAVPVQPLAVPVQALAVKVQPLAGKVQAEGARGVAVGRGRCNRRGRSGWESPKAWAGSASSGGKVSQSSRRQDRRV